MPRRVSNLMNLLTLQTLGTRTVVTGRDKDGIKAYARLLQSLNLDPSLADVTATWLARMLGGIQSTEGGQGGQGDSGGGGGDSGNGPRPLDDVDGLLAIPGYTADAVRAAAVRDRAARPHPDQRQHRAGRGPGRRHPQPEPDRARALVQARDRAYFRNVGDVTNQLRGIAPNADNTAVANLLDVQTHYFLVYGMARHERAQAGQVALVSRGDPVNNNATRIVWVRRIDNIPS